LAEVPLALGCRFSGLDSFLLRCVSRANRHYLLPIRLFRADVTFLGLSVLLKAQYFARSGEFGAPLAAAKATSAVSMQAGTSINIHRCFIAVSLFCYRQVHHLGHKEEPSRRAEQQLQ
jgi:hypothetical protein